MLRARGWVVLTVAMLFFGVGFVLGRTGRFPLAGRFAGTTTGNVSTHSVESRQADAHDHEAHGHAEPIPVDTATAPADDHEAVIDLTPQAYANLQLHEGTVAYSDYWRTLRVPARVIEKSGHSSHSLAAPVHGIVRRVLAVPGQAISSGDPLVELRVTDEELSQAQLDLLQDITRLEVIATELRRLEPLIAEGSVSGRQQRELLYEQQQLTAKRKLHEQELLLHGLDDGQVQDILASKNLVRDFTVRLIDDMHRTFESATSSDANPAGEGPPYTVERLVALPGTAVRRGDDLCELAYHAELYVQGQAFEDELDLIAAAADQGWTVTAEFGLQGELYERPNLTIEYLDNHADAETQTFAFYVVIKNEVVRDVVNDQGIRFRTWRFKPGQRAHLKIPVERWTDQFVLPTAAVVEDGLDAFVFRRHDHSATGPLAEEDHAEDAVDHGVIEFERLPVHVLYRSSNEAVIDTKGPLRPGDLVALDRAYELNLALKRSSEEGSHDHNHAH